MKSLTTFSFLFLISVFTFHNSFGQEEPTPGDTHGLEPDNWVEIEAIACEQCDLSPNLYYDNIYDLSHITKSLNVPYSQSGILGRKMDIYRVLNECEDRPVVIFLPGSGFLETANADPKLAPQSLFTAAYFAKKGYVVAVVDYQRDLYPFNDFLTFNTVVHGAAKDVTAAIHYLVGNKNVFNIDENNIFVIGSSAGGIAGLSALFSDNNGNLLGTELNPSYVSNDLLNTRSLFPNTNEYTVKAFSGISTCVPTENIFKNRARNIDLSMMFIHSWLDPVTPYGLGTNLPLTIPITNQKLIKSRFAGPNNIVNNILNSGSNNCFKVNAIYSNQHNIFSPLFPLVGFPNYEVQHHNRMRDFFYERLFCRPVCERYRITDPIHGPIDTAQFRRPGTNLEDSNMVVKEIPIDIFPNPAVDQFTISGLLNNTLSNVKVYNMTGKLVLSKDISDINNKVDVSFLASGLYIVSVTSGQVITDKKLTIR